MAKVFCVDLIIMHLNVCEMTLKRANSCNQGCQILHETIYQNGEKSTKLPQNYQMTILIPNGHYVFQMGMEYMYNCFPF
jgi:hypothetical protein